MFTYNLIELHLILKMLVSEGNTADKLMTFVQVIPAKVVLVSELHTHHGAVNQEENFYFRRKRKTAISPPIEMDGIEMKLLN